MKKLLPVLLALAGLAGGVGAGALLKPPEAAAPADPHAAPEAAAPAAAPAATPADPGAEPASGDPLNPEPAYNPEAHWEYVKLENQFVVPVMGEGKVVAVVVLSISLEVEQGRSNDVFQREPKLRDAFLRALFEHERAGGFTGVFTDPRVMGELRGNLRRAAKAILGPMLNDVLVTDILRQDM
jgi:flagellar protein FliL